MATTAEYLHADIWGSWNDSTATTYTTSTSTDVVWSTWTSSDATSYSSTSTAFSDNQNYVWRTWTSDVTEVVTYHSNYSNVVQPTAWRDRRTTEEKRAQKAQQTIEREWRKIKAQEFKEEKEHAELTAQKLLEDLISEEEMAVYKETGLLVVKGRKFDYVLRKGGGVYRVEKGKVCALVRSYCIHLREKYNYPETDNVIALKLFLEADEENFLGTANDNGETSNGQRREEILKLVAA